MNMNSYPILTRFKYEIALNCVKVLFLIGESPFPLDEGRFIGEARTPQM